MIHPAQNTLFRRRSSQPISWLSTEKLTSTQQKQTRINNKIHHNINTKNLKPGLIACYDLWPGNRPGLSLRN